MARILIAGCGDVGGELGRRLAGAGHRVFGLRRNAAALPPEVEPVAANLTDPASLQGLPADLQWLVYSAAADGFTEEAYERAYVSGVRNVLAALEGHPLARVLFVSSTGVYAQDDGGWVDEDSPTRPAGFSGRRLLEGEGLVRACGVPAVSVRFGGIYGPGRTRLVDQVRAGASCSESPIAWTNRIHRDDCAGVLAHLLALDAPAPVYVGVDCEPAPRCEVLDWLAGAIDAPRPRRVPGGGQRARGGNKRCSNRRLLDSGYRFRYPSFREGYAAMLAAG